MRRSSESQRYSACWSSRELKFDGAIPEHLGDFDLGATEYHFLREMTSYKLAEKRNVFKRNLVVLKNSKNYFKIEAVISRPIFHYLLFFDCTKMNTVHCISFHKTDFFSIFITEVRLHVQLCLRKKR